MRKEDGGAFDDSSGEEVDEGRADDQVVEVEEGRVVFGLWRGVNTSFVRSGAASR